MWISISNLFIWPKRNGRTVPLCCDFRLEAGSSPCGVLSVRVSPGGRKRYESLGNCRCRCCYYLHLEMLFSFGVNHSAKCSTVIKSFRVQHG